ncbi:type-F conjugative transfer system protein TrbI [Kosakonia radicincitans]|uniref:type-F conjugative transfer system protein TrbI n=1 Tax=Kosakonia radicincitans TaxID=283686 RepID=UPI00236819E8|nr:type-F conjugative transfer system protein TrbI [Kosakonia radicincitans]MDD7997489.1 type-F conjugative transfer system protein TrbI [Kosakonia radicincitans]
MNEHNEKPDSGDVVREGGAQSSWLVSIRWRLVVCMLVSQMIMTGISWIVLKADTPEVVTFDMKGTWDIFMQQSAQQKLDEAKAKALVTRFNLAMSDSLTAWQKKHNVIILVQPAVVSAQQDITTDIRNDIAMRMQEGK